MPIDYEAYNNRNQKYDFDEGEDGFMCLLSTVEVRAFGIPIYRRTETDNRPSYINDEIEAVRSMECGTKKDKSIGFNK